MQKIALILLIALGFTACNKDSSKTVTKITIVGKWNYKNQRIQVKSTSGTLVSDTTTTSFRSDMYLVYNADGTGVAYGGYGTEFDFTYSISGNLETEYQTPRSAGQIPYLYSITLTSTTLTRHSEITAHGFTSIEDDVLVR